LSHPLARRPSDLPALLGGPPLRRSRRRLTRVPPEHLRGGRRPRWLGPAGTRTAPAPRRAAVLTLPLPEPNGSSPDSSACVASSTHRPRCARSVSSTIRAVPTQQRPYRAASTPALSLRRGVSACEAGFQSATPWALQPPSIGTTIPVMNDAAGVPRKYASSATSAGSPNRCIGMRARNVSGSNTPRRLTPDDRSVVTGPGALPFARWPRAAHSDASPRTSPPTPALPAP